MITLSSWRNKWYLRPQWHDLFRNSWLEDLLVLILNSWYVVVYAVIINLFVTTPLGLELSFLRGLISDIMHIIYFNS